MSPHDLDSATRHKRWTARTLGVLAVVAVSLGFVASPATAAPQLCSGAGRHTLCIDITSTGNGSHYHVNIAIDVNMSGPDARAIINQPGNPFTARLMGADSGSADDFLGSVPMSRIVDSDEFGLGAEFFRGASRFDLDEDDNFFDDRDEVYVEIVLVDSDRGTTRTFRSEEVRAVF